MFNYLSQTAPKRTIGLLMFFLLLSELIVGGVLLPYKETQRAQAIFADYIGGPSGILDLIRGFADDAMDVADDAYNAAASWISSGVDLWNQSESVLKTAAEFAWNRLRRMLLNMIVNDIVKWVQGGGSPRFVTDWQKFIKTAGDKAAGQLIDEMGLGFLCSTFSTQLRIALSSPKEFDETATCTLSKAFDNINNFFDDFSKGGWKGWVTISESQNNYMGAYFMALNKKYAVMSEAADAAKNESIASAGFLGDKVCREATDNYGNSQNFGDTGGYTQEELPAGYNCTSWETRTPGRIVGDSLEQAVNIDIPWIIQSKEFAEYAGAIVDAVINRTIKEGILALTSTSEGNSSSVGYGIQGVTSTVDTSVNISSYDEATKNSGAVSSLIDQTGLLKENLETNVKENQTNLGMLVSIRDKQATAMEQVRRIVENRNCSLPPNASILSDTIIQQPTSCNGTCPCSETEIHKKAISVSNVGTATLTEAITTVFVLDGSLSCGPTITKTATLSDVVYAISPEITETENNISIIKNNISRTSSAITLVKNYQTAINGYMSLYESQIRQSSISQEEKARLKEIETQMMSAKSKAASALKEIVNSSSSDFNRLNQEIQKYSVQEIIPENSALMQRRGGISECTYATAGTLYKSVCEVTSATTSIESYFNQCQNPTIY